MNLYFAKALAIFLFSFWVIDSTYGLAEETGEFKIDLSPNITSALRFSLVEQKQAYVTRDNLEIAVKQHVTHLLGASKSDYQLLKRKQFSVGPTEHVVYSVLINNVLVENINIAVHLYQGSIIHINGTGIRNLSTYTFSPTRQISSPEIKTIVAEAFDISDFDYYKTKSVFLLLDDTIHYAERVTMRGKKDLMAWKIFVSAYNGDILTKTVLNTHLVEGSARVFMENKVKTPTIQLVELPNLAGDNKLNGKYARVINKGIGKSSAISSTQEFIYDESDTHFAEASTYFYADAALTWFDQFDLPIGMKLTYNVHVPHPRTQKSWNNANYDPIDNTINIGDGDGKFLHNLGQDFDVIVHETCHHIIFDYGDITSLSGESGAIHEGTADFFTYHLADDNCLGESAIANGSKCIRTGNNSYHYPDDIDKDVHVSGDIWSATLWDIRAAIDKTKREEFAALVLKSLAYIQNPRADFIDFTNALLLTDKTLYEGKYKCFIATEFKRRGYSFTNKEIDTAPCNIDPNIQNTLPAAPKPILAGKGEVKIEDDENKDEKSTYEMITIGEGCAITTRGSAPSFSLLHGLLLLTFSFCRLFYSRRGKGSRKL